MSCSWIERAPVDDPEECDVLRPRIRVRESTYVLCSAVVLRPLGSLIKDEGLKDEVLVPMTPLEGMDRRLLLWRTTDEPDFSEREKAMLALIRPHLAELHTRRNRELRGEPNLTPRQWEVLRQGRLRPA